MYAVIATGGKQYRVRVGDILDVEHLSTVDDTVTFAPVLVSTDDGKILVGPEAKAVPVGAVVLGDAKGVKIVVFKYRNKTGYASRNGHRQLYSRIEILSIGTGGTRVAAATAGASEA